MGGSPRIVLPSQPVCNLSHGRNRWGKKEWRKERGRKWRKEKNACLFSAFFTLTVTDEESIRPCVTRNKMIQENAASNKFSVILLANCIFLATAFPFFPDSGASPCLTRTRRRHPLLLISAPDISRLLHISNATLPW